MTAPAAPSSRLEPVCPDCRHALNEVPAGLKCDTCDRTHPVSNGVPILLGTDSAFDATTIMSATGTYFEQRAKESPLKRRLRQLVPSLGGDRTAVAVDAEVNGLIASYEHPVGLVIGAGTRVQQYRDRFPRASLFVTDVDLTYSPDGIVDALALPFADASVDLVVSEHVIEHLVDPLQAAREIERVLRPGGIVLIKMPFLYPWHGGYIDFFRATPAGMRAMFAGCDVVRLTHGMGPGAAAAYALSVGGTELFHRREFRMVASGALRFALSWIKWLDPLFGRHLGSVGASAGISFVGRRATARLTTRELIDEARRIGQAAANNRA